MGKAKRKPRPSMPYFYWLGQDGCWFCKNRNGCNSCKANRSAAKNDPKLAKKQDKIARIKEKEQIEGHRYGSDACPE